VQEPELRHDKEQEEDAGSPRVQKVLQKVQEPYSSQRDEMIPDLRLPILDFGLRNNVNRRIGNPKSA